MPRRLPERIAVPSSAAAGKLDFLSPSAVCADAKQHGNAPDFDCRALNRSFQTGDPGNKCFRRPCRRPCPPGVSSTPLRCAVYRGPIRLMRFKRSISYGDLLKIRVFVNTFCTRLNWRYVSKGPTSTGSKPFSAFFWCWWLSFKIFRDGGRKERKEEEEKERGKRGKGEKGGGEGGPPKVCLGHPE